jgi:hypothetical protein
MLGVVQSAGFAFSKHIIFPAVFGLGGVGCSQPTRVSQNPFIERSYDQYIILKHGIFFSNLC